MSQLISPALASKLTDAGERIRRASEELETVFDDVERFLQEAGLGIRGAAWVETPHGPHRLVFEPQKDGKTWRLSLQKMRIPESGKKKPAEPQVETSWTLDNAPKDLVLLAATGIPNLVESISTTATEQAEKIEAALAAIKGPSDELTITDEKTRARLDRDFLEAYSKRMSDEGAATPA